MNGRPTTVEELRTFIAARFPEKSRRATGVIATGVRSLDDALGGGLAIGRLTELVSIVPSTGGQTVLAEVLHATRTARQRIALIDGADGFDADAVPADRLRHLLWVRARGAGEAFAAADILVRDGNYAVVVLDLRGVAERALAKMSGAVWHRLRHATEASPTAVLVQTTRALVPAVPFRVMLRTTVPLARRRELRTELADEFVVEVDRARSEVVETTA